MTNVFEPDWDAETDRPPYRWKRSFVGRRAGSRDLGASVFEVPPGGSTFPLHAHHANEELIVVLAGTLVLRTTEGQRELTAGAVVACPRGLDGAHRLDNRSDAPARVLIVSTMCAPDVNEFPDSGVVWARVSVGGASPSGPQLAGPPEPFDPLSLP